MTLITNTLPITKQKVYRANYTPPLFYIEDVDLTFDLDPQSTRVKSTIHVHRHPENQSSEFSLDGEDLHLIEVLVNDQVAQYTVQDHHLIITDLPTDDSHFVVSITTTCCPAKNTQLMGLYLSQSTFFTQCEPQGFRRITYFLDRPDIMACYRVTLRANQQQYPTLLSNGNLVETGLLKEGRHYAIWVDPFKKPSYLFALVAGHLVSRERRITSLDGKDHTLQVYVRPGDLDKTEYAMQSLVRAIAWDEKRFHLPLDLERFMIVAVDDFNIGAMENKGLNLFNTQYILANPSTATDTDFANILSVVGHEYFHNWTGNRVTCRDWFELTLKEGLTVFRDQAFSQDMVGGCDARITTRIKDVLTLRQRQFAEDASPMAHPIRPESYVEINNFYTTTIYEKGAEVVRMMQTLTGEAGFIQGVTLYFERFDGQAVRCEDFVQAIADANPRSLLAKHLAIFKHWYSQAGTPHVEVCLAKDQGQTKLHFKQSYLPNPGQEGPAKQPVLIPIRLGLIETESGKVIDGVPEMFVLNQAEDELLLPELEKPVTPSLLRGFSAPVILDYPYKNTDLLSLLMYDTDPFNRWEAAQKLFLRYLLDAMTTPGDTPQSIFDQSILDVIQSTLKNVEIDPGLKALILSLPTESYITTQLKVVDPENIRKVYQQANQELATTLYDDWYWAYRHYEQTHLSYQPSPEQAGPRALRGLALQMLLHSAANEKNEGVINEAYHFVQFAGNMTERYQALTALVVNKQAIAPKALDWFYHYFVDEALVIDKWFSLQARNVNNASEVQTLIEHEAFTLDNPNRLRSVIFSFCQQNLSAFHQKDGSGYHFWQTTIHQLDGKNPHMAARLARSMDLLPKLATPYQVRAKDNIKEVLAQDHLSKETREVLARIDATV